MASGNTDLSLIGQFGVGFYSAYLVADKVAVITKSEEENQVNVWESEAGGTYTIFTQEATDDIVCRGTRIELSLKKDQLEYLEEHRLKTIVKTQSQYVGYPISLLVEKTKEEEVEDDEVNEDEIEADGKDGPEGEDGVTVEEADEDEEPKEK